MSAAVSSGVYPCYLNQFGIKTSGSSTTAVYSPIADCETFSVSIDNNVEEWTPFTTSSADGGWTRRLMTGKSVTISVTAKRNVGDTGNDKIAGMTFANGQSACEDFQWTFPDGTVVLFPEAVISVTNPGSGDSTNVAPLEFEVMSNGAPTVTNPT